MAHHPLLPYLHYDPDMKKLIQLGTFPAMVGLVRNAEGKVRGLHLIWLDQAGQGKLNLVYKDVPLPPRKMIGPTLFSCRPRREL